MKGVAGFLTWCQQWHVQFSRAHGVQDTSHNGKCRYLAVSDQHDESVGSDNSHIGPQTIAYTLKPGLTDRCCY